MQFSFAVSAVFKQRELEFSAVGDQGVVKSFHPIGDLHDVFGENDPKRWCTAINDEIFTEDCVFS